jgi:tetratricopeptide (TPR) repeat protein
VWDADPARRIQCSDEAIAVARRAADPALLARVLPPRFYTIWSPATLPERLAITTELLELADVLEDEVLRFRGAWLRFRAALESSDADEARRCQAVTAELADELRRPLFRWLAGWAAAGRAILDGRMEDALTGIDAARHIGSNLGDADTVALTQRCGVMVTGADVPGLSDDMAAAMARTGYPNYVALLAMAQARHGDTSGAWATLGSAASEHFSTLPRDVSWAATLACAAVVVAEHRDRQAAEALLRLLDPHADQVIVAAAVPFGSVSHFLGLLTATVGDYDRADACFATAATTHARMAAPAFLASTQTEWARLLLTRRNAGDAEQARELLNESLATARQLGLGRIERDAVTLLG